MKESIFRLIKIISIIVITAALGLDLWNIYLYSHQAALPTSLKPWFWLANIALFVHLIEGIIGAISSGNSQSNRIVYGIYTFFVGYVGLQELLDRESG